MNAHDLIKRHEGLRLIAYVDTRGNMTIGYGHRVYAPHFKSPISPEFAEQLFEDDFRRAERTVECIFQPNDIDPNQPRCAALLDMAFQLGEAGLRKFTHMIAAVTLGDWEGAAGEALNSDYARQVPHRAHDIANLLRTNDWASIAQGADHG